VPQEVVGEADRIALPGEIMASAVVVAELAQTLEGTPHDPTSRVADIDDEAADVLIFLSADLGVGASLTRLLPARAPTTADG